MSRVFGELPDVEEGSHFPSRRALSEAGVHRPTQAGISGSGKEGADSIVVSGGYEDDEDNGDVIIYTGHGGNDPSTRRQVADQTLERGNLALVRSMEDGLPVRVVRGAGGDSIYSPSAGFRYDGLYRVESYWAQRGRSGFRVYQYRLVKDTGPGLPEAAPEHRPVARVETTLQRQIRSSQVVQHVKGLHDYECQICHQALHTPGGPYAEGAHVRPLGRPHDGPDSPDNVLCLCPNDHVRFDTLAIWIDDELNVVDAITGIGIGRVRSVPRHHLNMDYVRYHRGLATE